MSEPRGGQPSEKGGPKAMSSIFEDFISAHVEVVEEALEDNLNNMIDTLTGANSEDSDEDSDD